MLNPSTPSSCSWKVLRIEDEGTAEIISSGSLEMREWNFQLRLAMHLCATNFLIFLVPEFCHWPTRSIVKVSNCPISLRHRFQGPGNLSHLLLLWNLDDPWKFLQKSRILSSVIIPASGNQKQEHVGPCRSFRNRYHKAHVGTPPNCYHQSQLGFFFPSQSFSFRKWLFKNMQLFWTTTK